MLGPAPGGSVPASGWFETPAGAEGWERLYPYYAVFSEDRRDYEEPKFWFHDAMHYPEPMYPFDLLMPENTWLILNQNTTNSLIGEVMPNGWKRHDPHQCGGRNGVRAIGFSAN